MNRNRIKLFNKKTMYEIYNLNIEKHRNFNHNDICVSLISKEKTLGPRCIENWIIVQAHCSPRAEECLLRHMEKSFINHLNVNVGLECLMKKEEVPLEVYDRIKS